jgi:hypothetical protein
MRINALARIYKGRLRRRFSSEVSYEPCRWRGVQGFKVQGLP